MNNHKKLVNKCIYCGSKRNLTDEHALPYALNGKEVLEKASCDRCQKITSLIELKVLRGVYYSARASFKLKTRRSLPKFFVIRGENREGDLIEKKVPTDKYGAILSLLEYNYPSYLTNTPYEHGIFVKGSVLIRTNGQDIKSLTKEIGIKTLKITQTYQNQYFEKFLAKVAYCYAIFKYGLESFDEIYVLPSIMGIKDDIGMWVGSTIPQIGDEDVAIELNEKNKDIICKIRIFGKLPVPTYIVVVGKIS